MLLFFVSSIFFRLSAQGSIQNSLESAQTIDADSLPSFNEKNWKKMEDPEAQSEFLQAWSKKDSVKLEEKYALKPAQRAVLSKLYKELNPAEKLKYRLAERKLHKKQKRRFRRHKKRYKKAVRWSKPDGKFQSLDTEQKLRHYKAKRIWLARKEAYRKLKVKKRFDRRENRLRRRYALSPDEKIVLNKAQGKALESDEKRTFRKARKKQIKFSKKLQKLRKRRHFRLQDKETRKRLQKQKWRTFLGNIF